LRSNFLGPDFDAPSTSKSGLLGRYPIGLILKYG
jgi:hypothetical protein